jgi:hypothetical protein
MDLSQKKKIFGLIPAADMEAVLAKSDEQADSKWTGVPAWAGAIPHGPPRRAT